MTSNSDERSDDAERLTIAALFGAVFGFLVGQGFERFSNKKPSNPIGFTTLKERDEE